MNSFDQDDFLCDEQAEEEARAAEQELARDIALQEEGVHVTNPRKLQSLQAVYKLLKYITTGKNLQISCELNKPFISMAYIEVVGNGLHFSHPEWFVLCMRLASNTELYARTDGKTQINFTFNCFTDKVI